MARGRYFSDFERDVVRIGVKTGHTTAQIARFLNRTGPGVAYQRKQMEQAGTLGNLPMGSVVDDIAEGIDRGEE